MSRQLDELMQAAAAGPAQVHDRIAALGAALTPALAAEAHEAFVRAAERSQLNTAYLASLVSTFIYSRQGLMKESLNAYIDWTQVRFIAAQSVEDYASVHDVAVDAAKKAGDIKATDLTVKSLMLAADSAYFASEAAAGNMQDKQKWLRVALEEALNSFTADPKDAVEGVNGIKLLGIVCSVVDELPAARLDQDPKILDALRRFTALAEANMPMDYAVPDDPRKTEWIRRTLAGLSTRLGDKAKAQRRLAGKG